MDTRFECQWNIECVRVAQPPEEPSDLGCGTHICAHVRSINLTAGRLRSKTAGSTVRNYG